MRIHVLCLCAVALAGCAKQEEQDAKPVVAVRVAKAEVRDVPLTITAPATVFPREQANIAARVAAPIRQLQVRKGDSVKAGQVLALLENRDVVAQEREAEGAVVDAEANLQKLTGGSIPTEIGRAEGQVETTRAALDQAQKNFERRQTLFQQGAIPNRDLLQTQTELATAKANYEVAVRALELLKGQSRAGDIRIAQAKIAQSQARLANVQANLNYMELRAPFDGVVTEQFQYPGDLTQPNSPVFTIMDLSAVTARAQVPEADAARLSAGQACDFASGDAPDKSTAGKVTVISRAVDPQRRTVEVWCQIDHPPLALRAGVFGSVVIRTGQIPKAVVVPASAVQFEEGTHNGTAFVVDGQHVAHKREVEGGAIVSDGVVVTKGIEAGEMVVVEGGYGLPDKTQVTLPGDPKK